MTKKEARQNIAFNIRKVREQRGLTQAEAAALIKKDRQSWQRLESGTQFPGSEYLLEVAQALNVHVSVFFIYVSL
jgi:transcriptional regulator with XRE-family HTH domain